MEFSDEENQDVSSDEEIMDMEIDDDEYNELENTIYELIHEKINENPLMYSDPYFHEKIIDDIHELLYDEWEDAKIINQGENIYDYISQISENFFELYYPPRSSVNSDVFVNIDIDKITQTIELLKSLPQPAQKTLEWYQYRHNMLTAFNIWKVFSTESQRNSLIYDKCKQFNPNISERNNWYTGGSLQWGVLYESVSIMIYENKYNTRVADFGSIQHQTYECIGASPDGINVDPTSKRYGRMVEVKNIVNRDITDKPKEDYWIQMQIQMDTCNLDECDFIETRFKEYESETDYSEDTEQEWKGIILCFVYRDTLNTNPLYKYMPFGLTIPHEEWIANTKDELKDTMILYKATYWYLDEFSCILVKRNRLWFQAALPKILDTWDTILKERETGYEHRAPKKRNCELNVVKPICLLKLDHD